MFRSLLIANRGEIACRIIRTARAMGIRTIAVYSDADASARFVRLADEAWRLGPAPARDSYLRAERILDARASGAEAIHPGYGFCPKTPNSPRPAPMPAWCLSARRRPPSPPWAANPPPNS